MIKVEILGYCIVGSLFDDGDDYRLPILGIEIEGKRLAMWNGGNIEGKPLMCDELPHFDFYWNWIHNNPSKFLEDFSVPLSSVDQKLWHHNYLRGLA